MHISVPVVNSMEYINATQVSPLISHVQIKVCYVGQDPNRNGTVITKEVAINLGKNLPGCPIVRYYNNETEDFEAHNREVIVEGGKFKLVDTTKPYGFVDIGAKVWFEKFIDDGVEHEYLCTEGYLWTGVYKESKRVIEKGNNQSMELNSEYEKGFWTKDSNSGKDIFIINDGLIEKLCILGSDVEPCFEGAQIKSFSLASPEFAEFKATMYSMISELKEALNKGGSKETMDNENKALLTEEETSEATEFEKKATEEQEEEKEVSKEEETKEDEEEKKEEEYKEDKKRHCELSEEPEYISLQNDHAELQGKYSALEESYNALSAEIETLRAFKLAAERKEKENMVASFYMLSDEEKKDVVENIDTYSLEDIEAKLSIICVRNKVSFSLDEEIEKEAEPTQDYTLNVDFDSSESDDAPQWVRMVREKEVD